jgi:hypothetical protein
MSTRRWWRQATPVGEVFVETDDGVVVRLALPADDVVDPRGRSRREPAVARRITEWGRGRSDLTDIPVDLSGADLSDFQRHVLLTLRAEIPAGETVTYGELAELVGRPGAARDAEEPGAAADPVSPRGRGRRDRRLRGRSGGDRSQAGAAAPGRSRAAHRVRTSTKRSGTSSWGACPASENST